VLIWLGVPFLINQIPEENISDQEKDAATILRVVLPEQSFNFMTEAGVYMGLSANSLEDFRSKLETIDVNSVAYHITAAISSAG